MRCRKAVVWGCIFAITISALVGCGKEEKTSTKVTEETTVVQVTKVDGNTITATVGEWNNEQKEGRGEPPEAPSGEPQQDDKEKKEKPLEAPSGEPPEAPSGEPQRLEKGEHNRFAAGEKTLTFTVTEETKIQLEQGKEIKEAARGDIKENSILEIILDDNDQAQKVVIKGGGGPKNE